MRSLISRRSAQRGQQGMAMMAGLVIYVGLSGVALVALLNMSFTSLRIADDQETTAQELRAVDSALNSAVNELRSDESHATGTPNGDGTCARSLGRLDQPGLVYEDGLGNRVVVLTRCVADAVRSGTSEVSLNAMLGPEGAERRRGTARLALRPTDTGQLVVVDDWSLRPDDADDPIPPDPTTTTTAPPTTTTAPPTTAQWALTVTSDWTDGYCADVRVTNPGDRRLDWVVTVPVEGNIYAFWSGQYSTSASGATVRGLGWNRTLEPGAGTNFGFCANRPVTAPSPAEWTQTVTSDWSSGYCIDVRVTNPTDRRLDWIVSVPVEGNIYAMWNGQHTRSGDRITVRGIDWNRTLEPGAGTNFGFCANR